MSKSPKFGGMRFKGLRKKSNINQPLISVVTVVFNGGDFLEKTIRSVLEQSYKNIEYIIIDGGSDDKTLEIVKKFEYKIDYWLSEKDAGIYDAMNKALSVALGDWIIFIGSDDTLIGSIEQVATMMKDHKSVYYGDVLLKKTKLVSGGKFSKYRIMQRNICHQAIFYPKSIYSIKFYDTNVGMLADYKYNMELFGRRVIFRYLKLVISCFNDEGRSSGDQSYFIPIGMACIKNNFGIHYFTLKLLRNFFAKLVKSI
jgi:glycosyltransferase involved in cell wall biosynthesis